MDRVILVFFSPANQRLDSFPSLLDFSVLWQTFLCSLFTCYSWTLTTILYCVYHTQVSAGRMWV